MSRLEHGMTLMDAILAMSDGNPGAISVLTEYSLKVESMDPEGGLVCALRSLDNLKLYGPEVWMLFKDVCGQNLWRFALILRAYQLGWTSYEDVRKAVTPDVLTEPWTEDYWRDTESSVRARVPLFASSTEYPE